jgi:hypothetical protein
VARWDAEETSRKIELQVGKDLQFIRINGNRGRLPRGAGHLRRRARRLRLRNAARLRVKAARQEPGLHPPVCLPLPGVRASGVSKALARSPGTTCGGGPKAVRVALMTALAHHVVACSADGGTDAERQRPAEQGTALTGEHPPDEPPPDACAQCPDLEAVRQLPTALPQCWDAPVRRPAEAGLDEAIPSSPIRMAITMVRERSGSSV